MSLIAGVGDEVVQFVGVLFVLAVAALAWKSTNARPDRYRTVLVMRSRHLHHPLTVRIRTNYRSVVGPRTQNNSDIQVSDTVDAGTSSENTETPQQSRVIPLQEMDSIIDADMAMLDNNRMHFYRRMDSPNGSDTTETVVEESETQNEIEPASTEQMREMDNIVNAMETDITRDCDVCSRNPESNAQSVNASTETSTSKPEEIKPEETKGLLSDNSESSAVEASSQNVERDGKKILIKLKYLNDTCKEVEGNLDELLKDFKWRHFSCELSLLRRVRLIFNGRVLEEDASTLRACGLYHRAVVHAIVHQPAPQQRNPEQESPVAAQTHEVITENNPIVERTWDLENILMTLVSVALTVVWFFRCEYSNMFTASASVALFGLTVFYSVAIFGLYLSDTFHFDRRPERPVPAN